VARKGHPQIPAVLDLATYLAADHILLSFMGRLTGAADEALQRIGLTRRVVASMPLFMGVFDAVARSDAIATVPRRLAERYGATLGLTHHALPFRMRPFAVIALRPADRGEDPGHAWLIERIADTIAIHGPMREGLAEAEVQA
jgi:DNA-binding transcriptional LysR family regulator